MLVTITANEGEYMLQDLIVSFKAKSRLAIHISSLLILSAIGIITGHGYMIAEFLWFISMIWFMINCIYPFGKGIDTRKEASLYMLLSLLLMYVIMFSTSDFEMRKSRKVKAEILISDYDNAIAQNDVEWIFRNNQQAALTTIQMELPDKAVDFETKLNEFNNRSDVKAKVTELKEKSRKIAIKDKGKVILNQKEMAKASKAINKAIQERQLVGDAPIRSQWDGSYFVITQYLKSTLNDPDSLVIENCGLPHYHKTGWIIACDYRAKNGFGGYVRKSSWFTVQSGTVVKESGAGAFRF